MQLYLGIVPGVFPWLIEPKISEKMKEYHVGIMFSYWAFRKKQSDIISKGIHDFFSYDGPIMIDSGAYSAFNSGFIIQLESYSTFIKKLKGSIQEKDTIVNLDIIGKPKRSETNWKRLQKMLDHPILPVIHFPYKDKNYPAIKYIGLGGMVPAFKINQKGSVYDVVSWIKSLDMFKVKKFHGFGIGSPFHQIVFDFLYSIDWIGWRRNASVCSCYTPEGSRYVHQALKKRKKGKILSTNVFEKYKPPFIESYELLHKPGTEGWLNRALWNVWWFLVANDYRIEILENRYVKNLLRRI